MKTAQHLSVGFISLGCAKNLVDSEVIASNLCSSGFVLAAAPEKADIIIVNTCAFIHDARVESIDAIFDACELKKKGKCKAVMVAGCLPQRYRYELVRAMPEVDAFIGLDELERSGEIVARIVHGNQRVAEISEMPHAVIEPSSERILFTGAQYAYIKVSDGCNHQCSFCAIPFIRGRYRSRSIKNIVAEAERLLARDILELNLVSQDVTSYGLDIGVNTNLPKLLRALGKIGGQFWIRLLYGHPQYVTDELLETIGDVSQVCHYLDLPVQHSQNTIRKAMCREGTGEDLRRLFKRIRNFLPDITLRTTCIVGFPGETEEHFGNLLAFIKELRFDHVGVFTFSGEENTPAARLKHSVSAKVAKNRMSRLMTAQQKIVEQKAQERIGREEDIFVERSARNKRNVWISRSKGQAPDVDGVVLLRANQQSVTPGTFVKARYVGQKAYDILAIPV